MVRVRVRVRVGIRSLTSYNFFPVRFGSLVSVAEGLGSDFRTWVKVEIRIRD